MTDALTVLGVIIVLSGLTMASVNYQSSAERTLKNLGYTNNGGEFWKPPLGTPPAQCTWVGLTDDDIVLVLGNLQAIYNRPLTEDSRIIFAHAIEAKLKDKNT